jgi:predicted Fe-Mo cluster-binding NifX family protein
VNENLTKIAIPLQGERLSGHFGHPDCFALVSVDRAAGRIVDEEHRVPPRHEPGSLPVWLADQAVNVVLAGGIGPRAVALLESHGVEVRIGVPPITVSEAVSLWLEDALPGGGNTCDHGHGHGHGGGHCHSGSGGRRRHEGAR